MQGLPCGSIPFIEARGSGAQKGNPEIFRGVEYVAEFIPKAIVEVVVPDALVQEVSMAILRSTRTGKIGDGRIFVSNIDEIIDIGEEHYVQLALAG